MHVIRQRKTQPGRLRFHRQPPLDNVIQSCESNSLVDTTQLNIQAISLTTPVHIIYITCDLCLYRQHIPIV